MPRGDDVGRHRQADFLDSGKCPLSDERGGPAAVSFYLLKQDVVRASRIAEPAR
jgi:hypothetical protein